MAKPPPDPRLSLDNSITSIAARQLGLVTSEQVLHTGSTLRSMQYAVTQGRWRRAARGIYATAGSPATWEQSLLALCLATGGTASHLSAAVLHGFRYLPAQRSIEVSVLGTRRRLSMPGIVHVVADGELFDTMTLGPIPATGTARTILDLGATVGSPRHARILDDALDRRLVTRAQLERCLDSHRTRGRLGIARLEALLADRGAGHHATESEFERRFIDFCRRHGFEEPETQFVLVDDGLVVARCDAVFQAARVVVELDGRRGHSQLTDRSADSVRDQRLLALGWATFRVSWSQLRDRPEHLAGSLRAVLDGRS